MTHVRVLLTVVLLVIVSLPAASAAEQIGKANFASSIPIIEPKVEYHNQGDKVTVTYLIKPKTDDDRKKLDDRHYILSTELNMPEWKISIVYYNGGIESFSIKDEKEVDVHVKNWEDGLGQISINLTGFIPQISEWYQEVVLLSFKISDADEDSLAPITVKVVDQLKFEMKLSEIEDAYMNLYRQVENATFDVSDVLDLLKGAERDIKYAKEYYSKNKFEEAKDSLSTAKEKIENAGIKFLKSRLKSKFEELELEKKDISNELTLIRYELDEFEKRGLNVVLLKVNLSEIEEDLKFLDETLSKISIHLESENYPTAEKNIKIAEEKLNGVRVKLEELKSEVSKIRAEQRGLFDTLIQFLKQYLIYIGGIIVGIIGVVLATRLRGRRRKWDELR